MKPLDKYSSIIVEKLDIPMRDGVVLKGDLFIKNDNKAHNILLQRTPYPLQSSIALINALDLARSGWAVVIQNVRGRLESEGKFDPFIQEQDDGIDTLNWILKQVWCNGKIAMSGASYCGFVQWSAAYASPKGLLAISPQLTASDIKDEWFYEGGAFRNSFAQSWGLSLAFTSPSNTHQKKKMEKYARNLKKLYNFSANESPLKSYLPAYKKWIDIKNTIYWNKIGKISKQNLPSISAFHLTGWYDIFCEGALNDFTILNQGLNKTQRIIIGPWCHNTLFQHQVGQINFGYEADGFSSGIMNDIHSWMYKVLEGKKVKGGAKIFIMGNNKWKEFPTWPPKSSNYFRLYLDKTNNKNPFQKLNFFPSPHSNSIKITHNAKNLPISLGGRILDPNSQGAGPFDHSKIILLSPGEAFFATVKLKKSITVIGDCHAYIYICSNSKTVDFMLTLFDIHPDGKVYNIVSKTTRKIFLNNTPTQVELSIGATAISFKKNHSIGLRITTSNFPHLDINPSDRPSEATILFGGQYNSYISCPFIK